MIVHEPVIDDCSGRATTVSNVWWISSGFGALRRRGHGCVVARIDLDHNESSQL